MEPYGETQDQLGVPQLEVLKVVVSLKRPPPQVGDLQVENLQVEDLQVGAMQVEDLQV